MPGPSLLLLCIKRIYATYYVLLSPAKHSYSVFVAVQLRMAFPRACLAHRGIPNPASGLAKKIGILRAAATRENDKRRIQQHQNHHYDMQDSIESDSDSLGQAVAGQVETQDRQSSRYSRRGRHMGCDQQELPARIKCVAPRWSWWACVEANERRRSFPYNSAAGAESCLHHDRPGNR